MRGASKHLTETPSKQIFPGEEEIKTKYMATVAIIAIVNG